MKVMLTSVVLALLAAVASGQAVLSPVLVSFPSDTPLSVIDQAKAAITKTVSY